MSLFNRLHKNHMNLFLFVIILFWMKTYITYLIEFNLGIESGIQHFLLFINPLSSTLVFFGIALFFKGKGQTTVLMTMNIVLSILLYANVVYYRFFSDFITIPVIMQTKTNAGQLSDSALSLMSPFDIFYFLDSLILLGLILKRIYIPTVKAESKKAALIIATGLIVFFFNLALAEKDRPDLLSRSFDRAYLVKYLGTYNFTIYDGIQNVKSSSERAMADSNDITEIENYIKSHPTPPNMQYFGKAAGMNVIYISMESLQTFIIDYELNGMEVTPFLNSLTRDNHTFYFDHIYNQTGQGKTSDAEFIMDNALFPMAQGAVYVNKAQNTFHAMPAILKSHGYTSASFHGNYKTFWNRNEMYRSMGYDEFFDAENYHLTDENTKNYGLKDKPFFDESIPLIEKLPEPFYAKFITLSNHFPFKMDEWDTDFPMAETNNNIVNQYFQSAHYMDEALEQFFHDMKKTDMYNRTVFVLYGDHHGISDNHNEAMSEIIGKEITPFEFLQLQKVPVFIHVPGLETENAESKLGGQVDVRSTVLHLLGIDSSKFIDFGSDLLSEGHREIIPLRNGDFVSPQITMINEKFYDTESGELVEEPDDFKEFAEKARVQLERSDEVLQKDLLRFYKPKGFTPIDREDYQYIHPDEEGD